MQEWERERQQWNKKTKVYKEGDIYKTNDIDYEIMSGIRDVIDRTKGPYPAFQKKVLLGDLTSIIREVFEEDQNQI